MENEVIANWSLDLYVDCPHCDYGNDIQQQWYDQGHWESSHPFEPYVFDKDDLFEIDCDNCKKKFTINKLEGP